MRRLQYVLAFLICGLGVAPVLVHGEVDEGISAYLPERVVTGGLSSLGSDTLANAISQWASLFERYHPGARIQVQASGSSAAPPALTEGTVDLAPMSRLMRGNELAAFQRRYGYAATAVPVALDAVAVYVHRDNPLLALDLPTIDALFSRTLRCGAGHSIRRWGELGLDGSWRDRRVRLVGRNSVSGTYGYFKSEALCGGDFRAEMHEQPGSSSVVQAVGSSIAAIGFAGIGYESASVRALAVRRTGTGEAVLPTWETAAAQQYPLSRLLYIYINRVPGAALPVFEREFFRMVLSATGQAVVREAGLYPLPSATIRAITAELDL